MATTIYQSPHKPSVTATRSEDSIPGRKGGTTYAQKIAALQTKNELDLKLDIGQAVKGSGFVPPVFDRTETKGSATHEGIQEEVHEVHEVQVEHEVLSETHEAPHEKHDRHPDRPRLVKSGSEPTARPVQRSALGVPNHRILMRQKSVDIDHRAMDFEDTQPFRYVFSFTTKTASNITTERVVLVPPLKEYI